ncbi:MAG: hypothetical protein Kow0029_03850 [Candidatus Rifleibacteriota bacterium]
MHGEIEKPVLVVLPYLSCSGLELFGIRFAEDLIGRGIPARVVAPVDSLIAQQCEARKIPQYPFPETKKYEPWSFPACVGMMRKLKPGAVVAFRTQMMYPLHFSRLFTSKHIPFFLFYRIGAGNYYRNDPLHRRLFKHLAAVVPNADHVKNKILKYWAIAPEKVVCIKSGVDTNKYRPDKERRRQIREELGLKENDFLIGSSGRIHPEKGSEILLRALFDENGPARERKDVHLAYIGREYQDGYCEYLRGVAREIKAENRFHILPFRNDVETFYSALDLFAFAVTSHETYAYVVLEAMASGVAPIVPATGGMKEMYEHKKEGWFFEHRNTDSLRRELADALQSPVEKISQMGSAARSRIENTASWDRMMEDYLNLFRKCGVKI